MAKRICVLTPREGVLLQAGILPESACRNHRHIDYSDAAILANGAETIPKHRRNELNPDGLAPMAEDYRGRACAWAEWGELPTDEGVEHVEDVKARLRLNGFSRLAIIHELQRLGYLSMKHIVLRMAKEWTASQSWLPIGTERRIKHGKTRVQRPVSYSLTQCADNNGTAHRLVTA